ncbi:MAG TPA: hypothetical protein VFA37_01080 [Gaiellaceae bacterium]|nr:hypothetical protein [Gaiellaceae bacterium]
MNKFHVTVLAVLFGGAAVLGAVAVTRTMHLGAAARHANDNAVAAQARQLTAYAAKLRQELKARPPALPKVPKAAPAAPTAPASAAAAAPRVVYQQPPPIVVTIHKHHGDDGGGDGGGGGGGDG